MPGASSADLGHDVEHPARFPDTRRTHPCTYEDPVTRDPNQHPATAGQHAGMSDAERQEKITRLFLRRSKLSPDEAALLRQLKARMVAAKDAMYVLAAPLVPPSQRRA